jgi:hypothetical protein
LLPQSFGQDRELLTGSNNQFVRDARDAILVQDMTGRVAESERVSSRASVDSRLMNWVLP